MAYIKGEDRHQKVLFPDCVEDYVEEDAPVRLFDAFVDRLDMESLGFIRSTPNQLGTPGYDPRDLLKLYLYGYFYQVRSSRRLARECICNVEVMWLLSKLTPDFRTISDFRKDNRAAIHKVFKEFNRFCMDMKILSRSYIAIDGSKFKAVNAKDKNFTLGKLDDRIKRLNEHIVVYMRDLDSLDDEEDSELSREDVKRKLDKCVERKVDLYTKSTVLNTPIGVYMKNYSQEFKDQAVKLSEDVGVKKAAEQLGVSINTLSFWRRAKKKMPEGKTFVLSAREKELQKENEELKKTVAILREAMRFFATDRK